MGWWITLGILFLLAILPLGVSVLYDEDGPVVRVVAGPLRIQVFPMKKKARSQKPKQEKPKKEKKNKAPEQTSETGENVQTPPPPPKKGGSLLDFMPLVRLALDFLGDFRRRLRVNHLKLHLTMAADDPCDLAVNYGRANAAMAGLLAQLERLFVIKKRDVHINCDFTASEPVILARLDLTITLGRILSLVVGYGVRALLTFLNIKKQQEEGGANL